MDFTFFNKIVNKIKYLYLIHLLCACQHLYHAPSPSPSGQCQQAVPWPPSRGLAVDPLGSSRAASAKSLATKWPPRTFYTNNTNYSSRTSLRRENHTSGSHALGIPSYFHAIILNASQIKEINLNSISGVHQIINLRQREEGVE